MDRQTEMKEKGSEGVCSRLRGKKAVVDICREERREEERR